MKGGNTVEIQEHLPLFAVNMGYESISRDGANTTQHLVSFQFTIKLPSPQTTRAILKRESNGRILSSGAV